MAYTPDFYEVYSMENHDPRSKYRYEVRVDFLYSNVKDLVVKGGEFSGFWNGEKWSLSQDDLIHTIDSEIRRVYNQVYSDHPDSRIKVGYMNRESSGIMTNFLNYCKKQTTSSVSFNSHILFADHSPVREDYSTYQLPYVPQAGPTPAFDELMSVLYDKEELNKILWALGATLTGEIDKIEKFLFLYGAPGTGKGTIMNVIKMMIGDYWGVVDLQTLTSSSEFATADIREVPVLIDSDTDLSRISKEQNLLRLTSHEDVLVRKLYKQGYPVRFHGLLITASNDRYRVKSINSGITRRAIVVNPTGNIVPMQTYETLYSQIPFEIPYLAQKCIDVYRMLGKAYYQSEVDTSMIEWGDKVFQFVRQNHEFLESGITLAKAGEMYKLFLEDLGLSTTGAKGILLEQLPRYFKEFINDTTLPNGTRVKRYFRGFKHDVAFPELKKRQVKQVETNSTIVLEDIPSRFDMEAFDYPAQYTKEDGTPLYGWDNVTTTLKNIDTSKLHFVRVPQNHIVIDFDLTDETGNKSLALNIQEALKLPETYTEVSKSGNGLHLHYYYDGDTSTLANEIRPGVEIKVYTGKSSLRRRYTKSNGLEIKHIASGLPLKEKAKIMDKSIQDIVWTEKSLRAFVQKCLDKEHHGATRPEVNFIHDMLNEQAEAGVKFDLSDMIDEVTRFAMKSTNQSDVCPRIVADTVFSTIEEPQYDVDKTQILPNEELYFYDVEIFPNLFQVAWKRYGLVIPDFVFNRLKGIRDGIIRYESHIILEKKWYEEHRNDWGVWNNPSVEQIDWLLLKPLVGFNNLNYDNHMLYAGSMGATPLELYQKSQDIIMNNSGKIHTAYSVSYTDVYEFLDKKQSLKKWQIELGLPHVENSYPWDQPLPVIAWGEVGAYCLNDTYTTEIVFDSEAGVASYTARKILCEITGMAPNTKTQTLAEKFLFRDDPRPQDKFNWYDLAEEFPGYTFDKFRKPQSDYKGKNPSEGGYVQSKPGVYGLYKAELDEYRAHAEGSKARHKHILYVDIDSMHPHSLIAINYFGPYTPKFAALVKCRMFIKNGLFKDAMHAFDDVDPELSEKLRSYLEDESMAHSLGYAMKIVINIIYGLTSAKWDNKFKDPRNIDNIVAKRGALFMMMAEEELEKRVVTVAHTKTDSFKLIDWTWDDFEFLKELASKYGYSFSIEGEYSKLALVNKSTLVMKKIGKTEDKDKWEIVGAQYAEPVVEKQLFTMEPLEEEDLSLLKNSNKGALYLGDRFIGKNGVFYASMTGDNLTYSTEEDIASKVQARMMKPIEKLLPKRDYVGLDEVTIKENIFARIAKEVDLTIDEVKDIVASNYAPRTRPKFNSVAGTIGYGWKLWSEYSGKEDIDMRYYKRLVEEGVEDIFSVGDGNIIFEGTKWERPVVNM